MNKIVYTIQLNKPLVDVFAFTLDPKNTPKWVDSIVTEETNEWPVKVGTIYRSKNKKGEWSELEITEFEENKTFTMTQKKTGNHVTYTFTAISPNVTELEYIWVDNGELSQSFIKELVDNLKHVIEAA